ncbi:uncharacterized protein PG998_006355 [Apiospora kogelbergensis]|uniref:uncharacterized protein n=1 Tax=Apiospora kogelbergensis TaxID=1337665 RepID=UPI0031324213
MGIASTLMKQPLLISQDSTGDGSLTTITGGNPTSSGNPTTPDRNTSSSNVTPGATAGATVGTFIGGLLIGLAVLLSFRRGKRRVATPPTNKRRSNRRSNRQSTGQHNGQQTNEARCEYPFPGHTTLANDPFQFDAAPDKKLVKEYRKISKRIQQHVDNFYHGQPAHLDAEAVQEAFRRLPLVFNNTLSPTDLVSLLLKPQFRGAAIRHIIAEVLVMSIDFQSPRRLSLLLKNAVESLRSFPAAERGSANAESMLMLLLFPFFPSMTTSPSERYTVLIPFRHDCSQGRSASSLANNQSVPDATPRSHRLPLVPPGDEVAPQIGLLTSKQIEFLDPFNGTDESSKSSQSSHLRAVALNEPSSATSYSPSYASGGWFTAM